MPTAFDWGSLGVFVGITVLWMKFLSSKETKEEDRTNLFLQHLDKKDILIQEVFKIVQNHLEHNVIAVDKHRAITEKSNEVLSKISSLIDIQQKFCKCINKEKQ